jgi:excisionase family DNA binding protein
VTEDRLLTAQEVARLLNLPLSFIRERTRTGELPCLRFGRHVRYEWEAVLRWVEEFVRPGYCKPLRAHPRGKVAA